MHDNYLTNRGTTTALADYAFYLTKMGHEITIGYNNSEFENDKEVIRNLSQKYQLRPYKYFFEIAENEQKRFELSYFIKAGINDGIFFNKSKSVIHSVFQYYDPHGSKYAYVSEWLANHINKKIRMQGLISGNLQKLKNSYTQKDWVPHMINLPSVDFNLRSELGIPREAVVGLRYGGFETYDVDIVHSAIRSEILNNPKFWFIAANTKEFWKHPRLLYIPAFFDPQFKVALLNTADFFLHARSNGESFGLSILEAMYEKLPVLSWKGGIDRNHIELLSNNSIFRSKKDLISKIRKISEYRDIEVNAKTARNFSPDQVMNKFKNVFMTPN